MKSLYLFPVFLLSFSPSFSQWTKIGSIPNNDIVSFTINNDVIYAASDGNEIYKSNDGIVWSSIRVSSDAIDISSIIFYDSKIFVGTFHFGVFFSTDNGNTWQNNGSGPAQISGFAIKDNILYASTLGNGVTALNSATGSWSLFNNFLPGYSVNVQGVIGSPNFLLIAAGSNGTFYRYDFNTHEWNEEYYFGSLKPGLQINRLINIADTLWAVNGNRIIKSSDAGITWDEDKIGAHDGESRFISAGTTKYFTLTNLFPQGTWIQERSKSVGIGSTWSVNEEFFPAGFSYDITEFKDRLFLGKQDGLYTKSLVVAALPVRFVFSHIKCENAKTVLYWETVGETIGNYYNVEKSINGSSYRLIGTLPALGNSSTAARYSFTDNGPGENSSYRIAEYDRERKVQYSSLLRSYCRTAGSFALWPNPTQNGIHISILSEENSVAVIKVFDSKGALVKLQRASLVQGTNQIYVGLKSLSKGIYQLSASSGNTQIQKTVQVIKQ
jgi:hypothetical protein